MEHQVNKFSDLVGKTIVKIDKSDTEMHFELDSGEKYRLYHDQWCCEEVRIEDICGDLDDLLNSPITMAEEVTSKEPHNGKPEPNPDVWNDSFTWTFYKLATVNGYVTIRWLGTSNGYYSEEVNFEEVK